jgi:hypothetical protein
VTTIDLNGLEDQTFEQRLFSRKKTAAYSEIDGEAVILELGTGVYYSLDSVGTHIWELMEEQISFADMILKILDEFDVSQEQCRKDVMQFLRQMLAYDLLEVETSENEVH